MISSRCTFGYHYFGTSQLDTMANGVANGVYNNPTTFPTSPITQAAFATIRQAYNTTAADYATYGATKKTAFVNAQKTLINALDLLADYVNSVALGDQSIIILAGFTPSSTVVQSNTPVGQINAFVVRRSNTIGEIMVEIPAIKNHGTINYFCCCSEGTPLTNPVMVNGQLKTDPADGFVRIDTNKSRKKIFTGLTPGVMYYFYVSASNTVSVSPLSDVKALMAA